MTNNNNSSLKGTNKMTKVSEIMLGGTRWFDHGNEVRVETPTDANQVFTVRNGETQRQKFIAEHGDVSVVWDPKFKVWTVPAFAEKRERFSNAKAKDCVRWGSE
tara:strand:- start:72 stop:383 length:312 start_codon:yes stop_codon:yes gene_type:complete